uniref:Uncharacterized protein n=1 Tax=uncultured Desulfobacterium sp. TaxID=201089 RepID=E1YAP3_9BACT|nr:unknown protein [uncultured Desulfobacterium sp.]
MHGRIEFYQFLIVCYRIICNRAVAVKVFTAAAVCLRNILA